MKRLLLSLCAVVGLTFMMGGSASAIKITETDLFGNETVILDVDSAELTVDPNFPVFFQTGLTPSPANIAGKVAGLSATALERPLPGCASFVYLDFGPGWQSIVENDQYNIFGRYLYVYYGLYDSEAGCVVAGNDLTGSSKYEWIGYSDVSPDERSLVLSGPYAMVSYNDETGKAYTVDNHYGETVTGPAYTLTFEGITANTDEDFPEYYPRVVTFADDAMSYFQCGSHYLYDDWLQMNWDNTWNGELDTSGENTDNLWDYITDGNFTDSDNPVIQVFSKAMQSLASVVQFVEDVPGYLARFAAIFPEPMGEFIVVCTGIIIVTLLIRFALHVIG